MSEFIVKKPWLPLPELEPKELALLEKLVLDGGIEKPADIPEALRMKLGEDAIGFVVEKATQVQGNPARLLELLKDLEPCDGAEIACERLFLKGFALSRLGHGSLAASCFIQLPARFSPKVQIELGLQNLNGGDFAGAESLLSAALDLASSALDPYSVCTAAGGLALALIHQGEFKKAEKTLQLRRQVLAENPSRTLGFGTRLYEILLLLEKNDFEEAARLLRQSLSEQKKRSINSYFLLHLQLRLFLVRNQLDEAGRALEELKATTGSLNLPEGVLDFRMEEIDWLLRSGKPLEARERAEAVARHSSGKDEFLQFRLSLLKALALAQSGQPGSGLGEITSAIARGEARLYRPGLVWAFFHAAGIALASGLPLQAKLYLNRGKRLAGELKLSARESCFSYMGEVLDDKYASASALVSLVKHQEIGPELEYFLDSYDLLARVRLSVYDGHRTQAISEPTLRRMLFRSPGIFWFQKEAILVANKGRDGVVSVDFDKKSPGLVLFRLLWNASLAGEDGLTLKDVHKARSPHAFREELHASAAKVLVSRLRDLLKPCGLAIVFDRNDGFYRIAADLPGYTIQSAGEETAKASSKDRASEILERIAMEPFVPTQTLVKEFGVTRQALHPVLSALAKAGRVRMVRRGPVSGYVYRG